MTCQLIQNILDFFNGNGNKLINKCIIVALVLVYFYSSYFMDSSPTMDNNSVSIFLTSSARGLPDDLFI